MPRTHIEVRESGVVNIVGAILVRFLLYWRGLVIVLSAFRETQLLYPVCIPGKGENHNVNRTRCSTIYMKRQMN